MIAVFFYRFWLVLGLDICTGIASLTAKRPAGNLSRLPDYCASLTFKEFYEMVTERPNGLKTVYIAGPMSGYPGFNFDAFFAAQDKLAAEGWRVKNPAAKDTEDDVIADPSFETGNANDLVVNGWDFRGAFSWDANAVIYGDAIYMLKGWEYSPGACAEHAIAKFVKKNYPAFQIMYEG